jgi:hypothetical protein
MTLRSVGLGVCAKALEAKSAQAKRRAQISGLFACSTSFLNTFGISTFAAGYRVATTTAAPAIATPELRFSLRTALGVVNSVRALAASRA